MNEEDSEDNIYHLVQKFLKTPPLLIWGSGATIPFGMPSMSQLNQVLKNKINNFDQRNTNLENELGKPKYQTQMSEIKKIIWNEINSKDIEVLNKIISNQVSDFKGLKSLFEFCLNTHPKKLNIVTTNYDRVLEYYMSYLNLSYTDGFNGQTLSSFDEDLFLGKSDINLIKVHGSLNWFSINNHFRFLSSNIKDQESLIIIPGTNKYQRASQRPYRELIQKSDNFIEKANSFLVVGFGFNDDHLTPEVIKKIDERNIPIVLITKKVTKTTFKKLKNAEKYIFFEEYEQNKTRVLFKKNSNTDKEEVILNGDLWQLNNFMEIL